MREPIVACYLLTLAPRTAAQAAFTPQALGAPCREGPLAIHRAAIDPAPWHEAAWALLSPEERSAMEAMRQPGQMQARTIAHGILRMLLGARLERPPAALAFGTGPFGKPCLRDTPGPQFSLAWREGLVAIAVADHPVGIDIETAAPLSDMDAVAAWLFSKTEAEALALAPPQDRLALFLRIWTRKEAACKAAGLSLDHMRGRDTQAETLALETPAGTALTMALRSFAEPGFAWSLAWG